VDDSPLSLRLPSSLAYAATSSSAPSSSNPPRASSGKPRESAAKRRARERRKEDPLIAELKGKLSALRSRLQASQVELQRVKADRLTVVQEHGKLASEIERLVKRSDDDHELANVKLAQVSADAHLNTSKAVRLAEERLREHHKLRLARSAAEAGALRLEVDHLKELSVRLRLERDAARSDGLRFNEERNALRKELADLVKKQSEEAVKAATATRLKFPGNCPE
jgi:hypothetical protein